MTGIRNSQVLLHDGENDSVATDDTCRIEPTWNASVCTGDIGRLNRSHARGEKAVNLESRTAAPPVSTIIRPTDLQASITVSRQGSGASITGVP